jgi:hypothetical protein
MKRALIILPLLAVMAGVASAQMLQPSAASSAAPAPANVPVRAKAELPPPPRAEASPTRIAQSVVARQAPVPMLLTSRPPAAVSTTAGREPVTGEIADRKLGETDAKAAIEADGYKQPRIMNRAADGTWNARALRGTVEVSLRVDAQGNVIGE